MQALLGATTVYLNGVALPTDAFSLSILPATVIFATAPPPGAVLSLDFTAAHLARFVDDGADLEQFMSDLWTAENSQARNGARVSLPTFPTLPGQGWNVVKTPPFSTRVAPHSSGREVRAPLYAHTLYEFELTFDALDSSGANAGFASAIAAKPDGLLDFLHRPIRYLPLCRSD